MVKALRFVMVLALLVFFVACGGAQPADDTTPTDEPPPVDPVAEPTEPAEDPIPPVEEGTEEPAEEPAEEGDI